MSAEITTINNQRVPPEKVELLLEQMNGTTNDLMEFGLYQTLKRVQDHKTKTLVLVELGDQFTSVRAYVKPGQSKLEVSEAIRTHLPGLMETLDG